MTPTKTRRKPDRSGPAGRRPVAQKLGAHHRVKVSETKADTRIATESVTANSRKSPDDVAHEKQRDQDGDERYRQGQDREADLLGSLERRLKGRHPFLDVAARCSRSSRWRRHDEAGRIVRAISFRCSAVAEQVHHSERPDERSGTATWGSPSRRTCGGEKDHITTGRRQRSANSTSWTEARSSWCGRSGCPP